MIKELMAGSRGTSPAPVLPTDKTRFPKLLLLDIWAWIALARSEAKPDHVAREALAAIRVARLGGKLVVGMALTNVTETALAGKASQRRDLATFMVRETGNIGLIDNRRVECLELWRAANQLLQLDRGSPPHPREGLLRRGLASAIGGVRTPTRDPVLNSVLAQVEAQPEMSVEMIVTAMSDATRSKSFTSEEELRERLEGIRDESGKIPERQRRELEVRNSFRNGLGAHVYEQQLRGLGIDMDALRSWLATDGNPTQLAEAVPHQRVFLDLFLHRDKNRQHRYKANDSRDFEFLKLAIPYANVVVLEKSWAHVAEQCGLTSAFNTTIVRSLAALPSSLREAGVLG